MASCIPLQTKHFEKQMASCIPLQTKHFEQEQLLSAWGFIPVVWHCRRNNAMFLQHWSIFIVLLLRTMDTSLLPPSVPLSLTLCLETNINDRIRFGSYTVAAKAVAISCN